MRQQHVMPRWFKWAGVAAFVLIVIALVVVPSGGRLYAEPAAPATVGFESQTLSMEGPRTVNVQIIDASNLAAYEFDLRFDQNVVLVQDIQRGSFLLSSGRMSPDQDPLWTLPRPDLVLIDNPNGTAAHGAFSTGDPPTQAGANGSGVLAKVKLLPSGLLRDVVGQSSPLNLDPNGDCSTVLLVDVAAVSSAVACGSAAQIKPAALGTRKRDFDWDVKADLGLFRNGAWIINQSSTGSTLWTWFGRSSDKLVNGDYDGDGKTNPAIFRDGGWYVRRPDGSTSLTWWGRATDIPVPGDYDGDGKTDHALFRNGAWIIRRSSDGGTIWAWFGRAGDKLVPADYDGDGKTNPAIFRDGGWYVRRPDGGTNLTWFGRGTDVPIGLMD